MQAAKPQISDTCLVVGAGPFGLIAARALRRAGIDVEIVERHSNVGGIWDIDNPGSPMYETCHFITSKHLGGFLDYPMPHDYPIYPKWHQILEYIRAMARDFGLTEITRFNTEVLHAEPIVVDGVDGWAVTTNDGETRGYRNVVYACGQQWKPFTPAFPGAENFRGEMITGNRYRSPDEFAGKRVVVVGAGNSGVDIAVDAADRARKAFLSMRRPYHFLPKQAFGAPTPDLVAGKARLPEIPGIERELSVQEVAELIVASVGDLQGYGLERPQQQLGSTQPIVSDLALHCFSHGTLHPKPNIQRLHEHTVEFTDGSIEEIDLVVLATGYDIEIPWLPPGLVEYEAGHPHFHLGGLALDAPGLYAVGVLHPTREDAWAFFDQVAQVVVVDVVARTTGRNTELAARLRTEYDPDLKGEFPFLEVRRNVNQVSSEQAAALLHDLEEVYGIELPRIDRPGFYARAN